MLREVPTALNPEPRKTSSRRRRHISGHDQESRSLQELKTRNSQSAINSKGRCRVIRLPSYPLHPNWKPTVLMLEESIPFDQPLLRNCLFLAWDSLHGGSASSLDMAKSTFRFALLHRSIDDLLASIRWSLHIEVAQDIGRFNENSPNNLCRSNCRHAVSSRWGWK